MSQQINLFNPIFLKQKKVFTALPMVEALGVIVAGALLLTWYAGQRVADLEHTAEVGKILLADRERRLVEANKQFAPRQKSATLATEVAQAEVELKSLRQVESVLRDGTLGNAVGYAEYFRALSRQNVNGLWLTGVSIVGAGNDIGVQGRAMQPTLIPAYIARLKSERVMRGKSFASLDISRPDAQPAPAAAPASSAVAPATAASATVPAPAPAATAATPAPFVQFSLQSTAVRKEQ
ncbi:MAG TPA: MSHA biogenesis protein MshA [Duganella sp.]|uniref:MSHA biogenesis protein MshA n=1 Tax=Duganella sp. TaxID=1904440 RepID=UPI002ED0FFD5